MLTDREIRAAEPQPKPYRILLLRWPDASPAAFQAAWLRDALEDTDATAESLVAAELWSCSSRRSTRRGAAASPPAALQTRGE